MAAAMSERGFNEIDVANMRQCFYAGAGTILEILDDHRKRLDSGGLVRVLDVVGAELATFHAQNCADLAIFIAKEKTNG
jgi:hypothetical protein